MDPFNPEVPADSAVGGELKSLRQRARDFKVAILAVQHHIANIHREPLRAEAEASRVRTKDYCDIEASMLQDITQAFLKSRITPLEVIFRSPDWRAGMDEARKQYRQLLHQGNLHPKPVREYLGNFYQKAYIRAAFLIMTEFSIGSVAVMLRLYRKEYTTLSTQLVRLQEKEQEQAALRAAELSILSAQLERLRS